jgi:hypothetical protein
MQGSTIPDSKNWAPQAMYHEAQEWEAEGHVAGILLEEQDHGAGLAVGGGPATKAQ